MSKALKRAVRTFLQSAIAAVTSSGVLAAVVSTGTIDLSALQTVGIIALFAGLSAVLSYVQNALEDAEVVRKVLR